jgi:hypothetical protein
MKAAAGFTESEQLGAYEALWNAQKTLGAGFTTVGTSATRERRWRFATRSPAAGRGPRIVDAARSISTTSGPYGRALGSREDLHETIGAENLCDGRKSAERRCASQISRGADVIKIATTGGVNSRIGAAWAKQMFDDEARRSSRTAHLLARRSRARAWSGRRERGSACGRGFDRAWHDAGRREYPPLQAEWCLLRADPLPVNGISSGLPRTRTPIRPDVRAKIDWRIELPARRLRRQYRRG